VNPLDKARAPGQPPQAPRGFVYRKLRDWLERPHADRVVLWLGFVLLLPSLDTGLAADDYLHTIMLDRPSAIPAFERAPLDIFRFCDPRFAPALLSEGLFSWWDDPQTKLAFLRPITAITHVFDHALFRNVGWFMHLHSALWALLLLFGVRALYRDLISDKLIANLAFALYALDDARGWLVSWVAARNAAVATAISVWTLVAHHRARSAQLSAGERRSGLQWGASLGPLVFLCALLAGEGSSAIGGYLLGYALFLDTGPLRARLWRLSPYLALFIVWSIVYKWLGYGVSGSSLYVHPQTDPWAFLQMLAINGPILLAAQFGGMWSDVWTLLFVAPKVRAIVYALSLVCVIWVLWVSARRWRSDPLLRFAAFGMLSAVVPASAVFPSDRLLTWIALGASVLLAGLIAPALRSELPLAAPLRATALVLVTLHLLGAVFLPSRARGNLVSRNLLDRADSGVPRDPAIADKTLIFVNPPLLPFAAYVPIERAALGVPRPKAQHILAMGTTALTLERIDANTLRVRARGGFLLDPVSKLMWSERRPFHPGERIRQADMVVQVISVTADKRPLEIEARFARPLEDPSYVWRNWQNTRPGPFTPPRLGSRSTLAGAEYFQAMLGIKLPIEARL
jgi:hypothetical protein